MEIIKNEKYYDRPMRVFCNRFGKLIRNIAFVIYQFGVWLRDSILLLVIIEKLGFGVLGTFKFQNKILARIAKK